MLTVALFTPAYRPVHYLAAVHRAREQEAAATAGYRLVHLPAEGTDIDMQRNFAIELCRELGADYLVMMDSDVWCEDPEAPGQVEPAIPWLLETLQRHGATAVAPPVALRRPGERVLNVYPLPPGGAETWPLERCGSGILAIDLGALGAIAEVYGGPWFVRTYADARQTQVLEGGDVHFSRIVNDNGGSLYGDARICTCHAFRDDDALRYLPGSAQATARSIVIDAEPLGDPRVERRARERHTGEVERPLLITGCPRSGTKWMATSLQALGIPVEHEGIGEAGAVSWCMADDFDSAPWGPPAAGHRFRHRFHQVRHPLACIGSLQTSTERTWDWLADHGIVERDAPILTRCMQLWERWNALAEKTCAWTYRIEDTSPADVAARAGVDLVEWETTVAAGRPAQRNSRAGKYRPVTWDDLDAADADLAAAIADRAQRYGYDCGR